MAGTATVDRLGNSAGQSEDDSAFAPLSDEDYAAMNDRFDKRNGIGAHAGGQRAEKARAKANMEKAGGPHKQAAEAKEARRTGRRQAVSSAASTASRGGAAAKSLLTGKSMPAGKGGTIAGAALGIVATAIAVNMLAYGPAGITDWLSAKFINKPRTGVKGKAAPPSNPSGPKPGARAPAPSGGSGSSPAKPVATNLGYTIPGSQAA
ncbi:MAG: hypothetical protein ACYDDZ_10950 [Acidimicrobiales bacterium]